MIYTVTAEVFFPLQEIQFWVIQAGLSQIIYTGLVGE